MKARPRKYAGSFVLLIVACICLLAAFGFIAGRFAEIYLPPINHSRATRTAGEVIRTPRFTPTGVGITTAVPSTPEPLPTQPPAIPEQRLLTLEWPGRMRLGDARYVQLTLAMDEHGKITPTAVYDDNRVIGEPLSIPNIYATHNVFAEARLDLAGLVVEPKASISLSLRPGETVTYRWNIVASDEGTFRGTVWLYLRFIPLEGGQVCREALRALDIEIKTVGFLGLDGPASRRMGGIGMLLFGLLGAGDIYHAARWLSKRLRKGK